MKSVGYGTASATPTAGAQTTTNTYDVNYRTYPLSQANALNQAASTSYDYALGLPVSETDANGAVTTAAYDVLGRITSLIRPGDTTPTMLFSYHIDSVYHLFWTETQQCRGAADQLLNPICEGVYTKLRKYYNGLGQLLQTQEDAEVAGVLKTVVTNVYYDAMGRLSKQAVPFSVALTNGAFASRPASPSTYTQTSYDLLGRVIEVRAPDGTTQASLYSIQREGGVPYNVVRTTNARGNMTYSWSDALGRTRKVVPASGPSVSYTYDAADRLVSVQYGPYTTSLTYDKAGRKSSMSDPDIGSWIYAYDAVGNLTQQTDARNCVTSLQYDALNRLLSKTYSNKTGGNCSTIAANTPPVSYSYDQGTNGKGRRTGMVDGSGSTSWQYDGRGRMTVETVAISGVGAYTTKWGYDSADRVASMVYPSGETVYTSYNAQGLAISLDSTLWPSYASQVKYDEAGRPLEWTLGNGVKTGRVYYPWSAQGGRLQSISSVILSSGVLRQNLAYGYDDNGNVTSVQDTVAGESLTYAYDVLDRLTGVSGAYSESYTYNPTTGNLASKDGQTLTYGASNHPHAATAMGSNIYTYDLNGNMLTRKISGVTYTLGYDAEGRLVSISGGGMSAAYGYNGDGERVKASITTGGSTKTTAYVGDYFEVSLGTATTPPSPVTQNCVTSKCAFLPFVTSPMAAIPNGQAITSYYYLGGLRIAIRVQSRQVGVAEGTYYPLSDHLGGTTVTLDASANRIGELRYKAWGQTRYTYGTTPTQRRYTGQLEAEAGLYFFNARWFDPSLGRFAQADTVIPAPGNPLAWDRYAYVFNNPVIHNDPTGHEACDEDGNCYGAKGWHRAANAPRLSTIGTWKMMIWVKFGVKMSDDGEKNWGTINLRSVYVSLQNINNAINNKLKNLIGGVSFWLNKQDATSGQYHGKTHLDGSGIEFFTIGDAALRQMNVYHEVGHFLDNVSGFKDVFTNAVESLDNPNWVASDGRINPKALKSITIASDPNYSNVEARQTFSNFGPSEQWADAFANYVAGNIKMSQPDSPGMNMYSFVTNTLDP